MPGSNAEFGAGVSPLANPARGNAGSITLGGSLQADSDRWNSMTPRGVLASATGGIDYEGAQRLSGGDVQPGAFGKLQDEMSAGDDDAQIGEE